MLRGEDALAQSARRLTASSAMPPVRDAAPGSRGGRFFAVPFDAIAGFGEVAEAARSLAKLPVGLDLEHFARGTRTGEESAAGRGRRRLQAPPDAERLSRRERNQAARRDLAALARHIKAAGRTPGKPEAEEERHEWQLTSTYCFFRSACNVDEFRPCIVPLQQSVERFFGGECPCVGDLFYPPGSCRSWHTDRYSYVGWAVYLVKVAEAGRSSFRYVDPCTGEMMVVPDRNDVAYFFRVSAEEPLFWHGVLCEDTFRWSQGFAIPQNWRSRIRLVP